MSFDPRVSDTAQPGRVSLQLESPTVGPGLEVKECFGVNIVGRSVDMEKLLQSSRRNVNWVNEATRELGGQHGIDMLKYNASFSNTKSIKLILSFGWEG